MKETFGQYLQRLKDRRTEDNYKYTDKDFENYIYYIFDCYEKDMSVYKCLEFMYFAEREVNLEDIFNDEKKEGIKKLIQKHKLINMMGQDEELGLYEETTLKEAAEIIKLFKEEDTINEKAKEFDLANSVYAFEQGAKWMKDRSYSEEDMRQAFNYGAWRWRMHSKVDIFKEWLKTFKKK